VCQLCLLKVKFVNKIHFQILSSGEIDIDNSDVTFLDIDEPVMNVHSDIGVSNAIEFSKEQLADVTLAEAWQLARLNKSYYFIGK